MTKVALLVEMRAKPGKQEEQTVTWFAVRLDNQTFAIFDTFNDDDGRQSHLKGPIAAALMARADELLAGSPDVKIADVLAEKLPPPIHA
jgi:quinol monooxygenase YgiN